MARSIGTGLRRQGMAVDVVLDGDDALGHLAVTRYDVVRVGPGPTRGAMATECVPGGSVAERSDSRVLMLTASATVEERVDGVSVWALMTICPSRSTFPSWWHGYEPWTSLRSGISPDRCERAGGVLLDPRRTAGLPGRPTAGVHPQRVCRPRMSPAPRGTGWSRPRNFLNGCGTKRPTRSPLPSRPPSAGFGPSSATHR